MEENDILFLYDSQGNFIQEIDGIEDACFLFNCEPEYLKDFIKNETPIGEDFYILSSYRKNFFVNE